MNAKLKNIILHVFVWMLLVVFLSVSMSFVVKKRNAVICSVAEVNISEANEFISETEVKDILSSANIFINGYLSDSVNLDSIEKILLRHNQVKSVETYITVEGRLVINIKQRKPVLRIFNRNGETFYIDEDGKLMYTSSRYTPRILVATGNIFGSPKDNKTCIPDNYDTCNFAVLQLFQLYKLAEEINRDPFMFALVDQIYVDNNTMVELIPKVSGWSVVIGNTEGIGEKFSNLKTFMLTAPYPDGWEKYKVVNLSFKNQVVCTKKTNI